MLALGLNLNQFDDLLKSESTFGTDTQIILLDNNGTKISDSSSNLAQLESYNHLQSFKNAREGKIGSIVENVNGKNMTTSYTPIDFAQSKWILLSTTPKD